MVEHKKPVCCDAPMRRMTICRPNGAGRIPVGYLCLACKKLVLSLEMPVPATPAPKPEKLVSVEPTCANCGLLQYMKEKGIVPIELDSCDLKKVCADEWSWQYWMPMPELEKEAMM